MKGGTVAYSGKTLEGDYECMPSGPNTMGIYLRDIRANSLLRPE